MRLKSNIVVWLLFYVSTKVEDLVRFKASLVHDSKDDMPRIQMCYYSSRIDIHCLCTYLQQTIEKQ